MFFWDLFFLLRMVLLIFSFVDAHGCGSSIVISLGSPPRTMRPAPIYVSRLARASGSAALRCLTSSAAGPSLYGSRAAQGVICPRTRDAALGMWESCHRQGSSSLPSYMVAGPERPLATVRGITPPHPQGRQSSVHPRRRGSVSLLPARLGITSSFCSWRVCSVRDARSRLSPLIMVACLPFSY